MKRNQFHKNTQTALLIVFFLNSLIICAQNKLDTTIALKEVKISVYPHRLALLSTPASISILNNAELNEQSNYSLVPALNSVAGIRMEERSPGSYRLSIRGSLLRSPFGIRNVKVYMDEFPLTDANGNTYLNLIDAGSVKNVEIIKGPEGSLFGANTGGVILLSPVNEKTDSQRVSLCLTSGSYGLFNQNLSFDKQWKKYRLNITESSLRTDGYRENSGLQRFYFQTVHNWNYLKGSQLKVIALFSSLNYQTPGGLTLDQFENTPSKSRTATSSFPSATEQKAGVLNKTLYGGISHEIFLFPNLSNVITLFGSHTDFENPFITNYEVRKENTAGMRTYFELKERVNSSVRWRWNLGMEGQQTNSLIENYKNKKGTKDTLMVSDEISVNQNFIFTQFSLELGSRWILEAAISLNSYKYQFKNSVPPKETPLGDKELNLQLMPRFAASYKIIKGFVWRVSASKGYSPPTTAEVRPSDNIIYTGLQPEYGWNYETGLRIMKARFQIDAVVFYFNLQNTIVRRIHSNGAEYFVNAGETSQPGFEFQLSTQVIKEKEAGILRGVQLRNSFTYYKFSFVNYQANTLDYSHNKLTGVPPFTIATSLSIHLPKMFYFFVQHNYTDQLPLNDANTVYANSYNLVQLKAGWKHTYSKIWNFEVFAGIDNLLDENYSLGNDLNAIGGRYYNAAAPKNYYGGVKLNF